MKKIFKVTNWAVSSFTSDNVANKTHWIVKSLSECFNMIGYNPTFTYVSASNITMSLPGDNAFPLYIQDSSTFAYKVNSSDYIWYVNTKTKEIVGCACCTDTITFDKNTALGGQNIGNNSTGNFVKSSFINKASSKFFRYGPLFCFKVVNNKLRGYCVANSVIAGGSGDDNEITYTYSQIGDILGDRLKSEAASTNLKYNIKVARLPLIDGNVNYTSSWGNPISFTGEFFEDVYTCNRYFTTPMKTADNTKYIYDGKMFIVDDATDIGTITT